MSNLASTEMHTGASMINKQANGFGFGAEETEMGQHECSKITKNAWPNFRTIVYASYLLPH